MTPSNEGKTEKQVEPLADDSAQTIRREPRPSLTGVARARAPEVTTVHPAEPPKPLLPGAYPDRIGDYELLEEVARGGMGIVFKARHSRLQRIVALKMILNGHLAGDDNLQRFDLEATATAQLQHPNIVAIYEVDKHEGQPYFTMEFIDGVSLAQRLEAGLVPGPVAARYLEQTARAVHFAHTRGILHRDLKPANVLIAEAGTRSTDSHVSNPPPSLRHLHADQYGIPKVTDFGLAKVLENDSKQTRSGAIMGTPSYMAPEQALARKNVGPACDVYSLGAILYELLTGRPPFQGETPMATMAMVIEQEPVPPRLLNPKVDAELETVCLKCLEKEPARRYLSAELLADDLRNYLDGRPISARRLSAVGRAIKWCRRKPAAAALVVVSIIALAALFAAGLGFGVIQGELRAQAERDRNIAQAAEEKARVAEQKAKIQTAGFRHLLYVAQYQRARAAWESGDLDRAQDWLKRWEYSDDEVKDLRGWEWYYLQGMCAGKRVVRVPGGKATAVAFRPDGAWLATADGAGNVQLWETATGRLVRAFKTHDYNVTALAFRRDGHWLAVAGDKAGNAGAVNAWDTRTGKEVFAVKGPHKTVRALAFSGDGRYLASGGDDQTVHLWNGVTGASLRSWPLIEGAVRGLAFTPDGNKLAAAAGTLVRTWDLKQDAAPVSARHQAPVKALTFDKDGGELVTLSGDAGGLAVRTWDPEKAQPRHTITLPGYAWAALAPDGKTAATFSADSLVEIWSVLSGKVLFSSRWHVQTVKVERRQQIGPADQDLTLNDAGSQLACASDDNVWLGSSLGGQEALGLKESPAPIRALLFHPGGSELASAGDDGVHFWDPVTGRELKDPVRVVTNGRPVAISAAAYSPDGAYLALAARDKTIRILNTADSKQVAVLLGHTATVAALAYSPDARWLASGGADKTIRIWDAQTGELAATLEGHPGQVTALAFSHKNELASADSTAEVIRIWDVATRKLKGMLEGHDNLVVTLAFSPNGTRLASGSFDKTIRLWDVDRMQPVSSLEGHLKVVNSVVFSRDGTRLFSGGGDMTVRVWDVVTRQELLKLEGGMREVSRLAVAARDGRRIACVGSDRIVRIWEAALPAAAAPAP